MLKEAFTSALPTFSQLLTAKSWEVRVAAARALSKLTSNGKENFVHHDWYNTDLQKILSIQSNLSSNNLFFSLWMSMRTYGRLCISNFQKYSQSRTVRWSFHRAAHFIYLFTGELRSELMEEFLRLFETKDKDLTAFLDALSELVDRGESVLIGNQISNSGDRRDPGKS